MAYTPPTVADFKLRFSAFGALGEENDLMVLTALEDAASVADDGWPEADRRMAVMLQAAHRLTVDGVGRGVEAEMAKAGALGFRSFRSGQLQLDRFDPPASSSSANELDRTEYGRRLQELIRSRFPGILVV